MSGSRRDARIEGLLAALRAQGIEDARLLAALGRVPRDAFCRPEDRELAWENRVLPLEDGATLSQPLVVAAMIQALRLRGGERVLDLGSGSGYTTALLCELAGRVWAVERLPGLAARAERTLTEQGYRNFSMRTGDGGGGEPDHAPFDAILISAALAAVPPTLLDQLAVGGRLVAPVGGAGLQRLLVFEADEDRVRQVEELFPVQFVPFRGP